MMKKIIQFILAIMIAVPLFGQTTSPTVTLTDVDEAMPGTVTVSLTLSDFTTDVGAITIKIHYDLNLLTYTGSSEFSFGGGTGGIGAPAETGEKYLSVGWFKGDGADFSNEQTLVTLQFNYKGAFPADLNFFGVQDITYIGSSQPILMDDIVFNNGLITPKLDDFDGTVSILDAPDKSAGEQVSIPLHFTNFTTDAYSANLYVGFDNNLAYVNTSNNTADFSVSFEDGVIKLARGEPGDKIGDGAVIHLNFTYLGAGDANIYFLPGSEAGDQSGDPLHVKFEGGKVTQDDDFVSTFEIARVITPGADEFGPAVEYVAVTNSDELSLVGALNLRIKYDNEKLDFTTLIANNPLTGWAFTNNTDTGIIEISREASTTGYPLPAGDLFTLRFDYLVVPPDPPDPTFLGRAEIVFDGLNMVGDNLGNIFNIGFVDGWIAMVVPGNANCNPDGIVNILDVLAILAYMADPTYTPFCFMNADVAEPFGVINILDVLEVLNIMAE